MLPQGLKSALVVIKVLTFRGAGFRFSPEIVRTRDKRVQGQHQKISFQGLISPARNSIMFSRWLASSSHLVSPTTVNKLFVSGALSHILAKFCFSSVLSLAGFRRMFASGCYNIYHCWVCCLKWQPPPSPPPKRMCLNYLNWLLEATFNIYKIE